MSGTNATAAVIGVGRCDRGDAAAGLVVADIVRRRIADRADVISTPVSIRDLFDIWSRRHTAVVIGAVRSGGPPGHVWRSEPLERTDAQRFVHVPQDIDVAGAVTLGQQRDRLPRRLIVYGIEGRWFTQRAGVSPDVAAAARDLALRIVDEITEGQATLDVSMAQ